MPDTLTPRGDEPAASVKPWHERWKPLQGAKREAMLQALREEDAVYERIHQQYGSFAEAAFEWLDQNPEET